MTQFLNRRARETGFTLLEMILVMVITGILAIAVIPRFFDRQLYDSRGFYDQTLAVLRYGQKAAVAQRRNVCVQFGSTSITLTIASDAGNGSGCTSALSGPDGKPYAIVAGSGIRFADKTGASATPNNFFFNALGQASTAQTFRVSGLSQNITVERDTGYVHP